MLAGTILACAWHVITLAGMILASMEVMLRQGPSGSLWRWRLICCSWGLKMCDC